MLVVANSGLRRVREFLIDLMRLASSAEGVRAFPGTSRVLHLHILK